MLSKLTPLALVGSTLAASNVTYRGRDDRPLMQGLKNPRPSVFAGDCSDGGYAVTRLKKGPANIPDVVKTQTAAGTKWSDSEWTGKDVLYEPGYPAESTETTWASNYNNGIWTYERWADVPTFADATLFAADGVPNYKEPRQGGAGTCTWISSMSGVAEWPELI